MRSKDYTWLCIYERYILAYQGFPKIIETELIGFRISRMKKHGGYISENPDNSFCPLNPCGDNSINDKERGVMKEIW